MKFEITAVVKEIGAIETVGQNGFQKRNLILSEVNGQYENLVCVEFSGEKLQDPERYQVGQNVKVGGFVNCNEWNGKYFTSLKGSYVQNAEAEQAPVPAMGQAGYNPQGQADQVNTNYQAPQPQGVDPSMAPPVQPYQAPQQAVPVPQIPVTAPIVQPQAPQQLFDANGNAVESQIPF